MFNEKKFKAVYADFLNSGLTIRDYCANQQMNEAKFYYWQNKLKGQLPPKRGFEPVLFKEGHDSQSPMVAGTMGRDAFFASPGTCHQSLSCEINYPNGVCVKLSGLSGPEVLEPLLALMRG